MLLALVATITKSWISNTTYSEEDGDVVVKRWNGNALNRRPRATNIN